MDVTFKDLVDFYRNPLFEFDTENSNMASFIPQNDKDIQQLKLITDAHENTGLDISNMCANTIKTQQKIVFDKILPRTGFGRLFENIQEILSKHPTKEPKNYYIKSIDFYCNDDSIPKHIQKYRSYISFISFLTSIATYVDESLGRSIFINEGRVYTVSMKAQLSIHELESLDFDYMESLKQTLINNDDAYLDNRKSLFFEALGECINDTKDANIAFVIKSIKSIAQAYDKRVKVFLSNFSYDKIINQLKTMQVEETGKIHKVFSDIQNHALALPIASFLAISQMREFSKTTDLVVNTFILAGVIIFVLIMSFLLWNQFLTLWTIETELKNRQKRIFLDPKYAFFKNDAEVTQIFNSLTWRRRTQKFILFCVGSIGFLCLTASTLYYIYLNYPSTWQILLEWVMECFSDHS